MSKKSRSPLHRLALAACALLAAAALWPRLAALAEGLAPYPSPQAAVEEIYALAQAEPGRAEVFTFGQSAGGRPLRCVRVHQGDGQTRPAALIAGNIHGDEYIGNRSAQAAAWLLVQGQDPLAQDALERMDVYLIPLFNPDGYQATWDSDGFGPTKKTRTNQNGVDLNRNFGKPHRRINMPFGYSGAEDPASDRWVGPFPLSEPETRAVFDLAEQKAFFAAVDFHSAGGIIIPMLADHRLVQRGLRQMALAYRQAQADPYLIAMAPYLVPFYQGSMEEGLHRASGTLPILIELAKSPDLDPGPNHQNHFWSFNPGPDRIQAVAEDNARAAIAALIAAHQFTGGATQLEPIEVE